MTLNRAIFYGGSIAQHGQPKNIRVHHSLFEISLLVVLGVDIQEISADILAIMTLVGRPNGPGTL